MNVTDTNSLPDYALHVLLLLAGVAAFFAVCAWAGRCMDRYLDRKQREAREELDNPLLAVARGHSTRLVRRFDATFPRQSDRSYRP